MNEFRHLVGVSRPRSWIQTALPFLVAAFDVEHGPSLAIVLGTLYFLGPYNLLRHGLDVFYDREHGPPEAARRMRIAIAVSNLPFLVGLVLLSGAAAGFALALAVAAAIVDTAPPLRTKERPGLDIAAGAMQFVLPAVCGFLVAGLTLATLPWLAVAAFTAWALASLTLGAVKDSAADRAAGTASIATRLGVRRSAMFSLGGYVVAAASAATVGPMGALAALGLDLYLLLPAMIILSPRRDPVAEEASTQRAWSGYQGLNVLVGVWLAFLLIRHWGATAFSAWEITIGVSSVAVAYALWNLLATRLTTRRRRARQDSDADIEALTIVVPCRDEAARLPACLDALMDQTYADTTILVVDDGSTDGTAEIAAAVLGGAGRVVVAPPKPEGWTGKSWACQVGADASSGGLLMFVDADTLLVPVATRIIVEQLQARRLDLLSGLSRYAMPTTGERAAVPGFALLLFGLVPIWLSALTRGRLARAAFAYGPLMLVRRDAYEAVGGHRALPGSLREDIDLARRLSLAGRRIGTVQAADLAATRHVEDADGAVALWRRIFLPYAGGSLALAIGAMLVETVAYLLPLVLPPLALLTGVDARMLVASFVPLLLLGAMRLALTLTQRQPLSTILWHPVTIGLTLVGQLAGIVDHVIGRPARWRGRLLPVVATPSSEPPG